MNKGSDACFEDKRVVLLGQSYVRMAMRAPGWDHKKSEKSQAGILSAWTMFEDRER